MIILNNIILLIILNLILFFFYKKKYLDLQTAFLLSLTSFPFFFICKLTNLCMYDYNAYYLGAREIKNFDNFENIHLISYFYYLFLPFINFSDVSSLGFINRIFYIIFFTYFYRIGFFKKNNIFYFFFLLYPSLVLYTNLGGEENIVAILLSLIIYFLLIQKNFYMIICMILLYFIKINLFYLFFPVIIFIYLDQVKKYNDIKYYLLISFVIILIFPSKINNKIEYEINWRKFNLYCEDINYKRQRLGDYSCDNVDRKDIKIDFKNLPILSLNTIKFLLSPMPDRITKKTHLIQFSENILLLIFLILISFISIKKYKNNVVPLVILIFMLSIYGNLYSNPGSAIRWKYGLIFMYMFYIQLNYFLNEKKKSK